MKYQNQRMVNQNERDIDIETGNAEYFRGMFMITTTIELNEGKFKYYDRWEPAGSNGTTGRINYEGTYVELQKNIEFLPKGTKQPIIAEKLDNNRIKYQNKEFKSC